MWTVVLVVYLGFHLSHDGVTTLTHVLTVDRKQTESLLGAAHGQRVVLLLTGGATPRLGGTLSLSGETRVPYITWEDESFHHQISTKQLIRINERIPIYYYHYVEVDHKLEKSVAVGRLFEITIVSTHRTRITYDSPLAEFGQVTVDVRHENVQIEWINPRLQVFQDSLNPWWQT